MLAFVLTTLVATTPTEAMGKIHFPVTGSTRCQAGFTEGMLSLHSFMYDRAHMQFQALAKQEPTCAMAYWGDAMAYYHPLWNEENQDAARTALGRINQTEKLSAKEHAYLEAARALWSGA